MSINRGMASEDVVYILSGILLSHKKEQIIPFAATWMELEFPILSEVSQKAKEKYPYDITYIWNLLYSTNEPFHRKETHGLGEQTCVCQGWGGSEMDGEFGVSRCKLLPLEWVNNEILM